MNPGWKTLKLIARTRVRAAKLESMAPGLEAGDRQQALDYVKELLEGVSALEGQLNRAAAALGLPANRAGRRQLVRGS